ncbi:hypothetical protein NQ317_015868 [Molorchus minor]|uniref:EGF-like domain-containing protein n=1 Tax=Molorchus minor TaxID=1323400 RepID=A0ABQ9JIM2_9CUCU|nr:hypothetical protein NQ317_015868 [Molorchus minor]
MNHYCCVPQCSSWVKETPELSFHTFLKAVKSEQKYIQQRSSNLVNISVRITGVSRLASIEVVLISIFGATNKDWQYVWSMASFELPSKGGNKVGIALTHRSFLNILSSKWSSHSLWLLYKLSSFSRANERVWVYTSHDKKESNESIKDINITYSWNYERVPARSECINGHHTCAEESEICDDLDEGFKCRCGFGYKPGATGCEPVCPLVTSLELVKS